MDSNGVFKIEDIKAKPVSIKMDNGNPLITLTWENINVHTPGKQPRNLLLFKTKGIQSKHIVKHVTGIAKPGTLTVIMGASGSGKSTFLNALNFRHRGDLKVTGDVKINGSVVKSREALASLSGYVQQDDLFVGTLNVGEQLKFQAFLRMSKSTSKQEKLDRVEELLNDLNLKKCEHTTIGIPDKCVKGISGGEKRRLAFACELITNPNLLFFDEPTSGLDSFMAMTIVETMRHLTEKGKTIVCTMHQPSSELFSRFDRLLLMAEGRLAFLGDIHDSNNFFKSLGYDCPYNYNPADFIIKTLAIEPSNRQTSLDRINKICDGFEKSVFMKDLMVDVKNADNLATNPLTTVKLVNKMNYNVNYLVQFVWLLWRELLANSRNPFTIRIAISQTLIVSLLLGLIFLRVNYDQVGVQNINGVLFLILTNLSFTSMFAVINNFPSQIHIFMREHQNGMYSVISYYFSKILADLPRFIILPFVMVTIIYWMSNCNNNVARFFICVFIIIVSVNVAVSFGTFISALAPTPKIAISLNAPLLVPLMIFSGYFINSATIPVYFIWLKYLSWWSYAFELLVINQWQGVSGIECSNDTISNCYHNGNDVIHDLSFTRADYPLNWIALFILFFGWKILAFVVLFLKSLKK